MTDRGGASASRPIVLVHTPKCAGKSLREALREAYGSALCLKYSNPLKLGGLRRAAQRLRGRLARPVALRGCACVYGHFSLERYRHEVAAGHVRTGMFFREPLDLLVSYYFYHQGKRRDEVRPDENHADGLLRLARQPYMRSFYRRFLGRMKPDELDYVGLFEDLDRSVGLFEERFGVAMDLARTNVTRARPRDARAYLEEAGVLDEVREAMADNRDCYRRAARHFARLCEPDQGDAARGLESGSGG